MSVKIIENVRVLGIIQNQGSFRDYKNRFRGTIDLNCNIPELGLKTYAHFTHTEGSRWNKLNLQIGDRVEFIASLKIITGYYSKESNREWTWYIGSKDYEIRERLELKKPKHIKKLDM